MNTAIGRARSLVAALYVFAWGCATPPEAAYPPCAPDSEVADSILAEAVDPRTTAAAFAGTLVAPTLMNRQDMSRVIAREYPEALRAAGIGGRVRMWFFVDATGTVQRIRLDESSGYPTLDAAARRVAEEMEFRPALRGGCAESVWVAFPIFFAVRRGGGGDDPPLS